MLFRAIEFAAHAHAGQYRKGTSIPYICHPLNVCQLLSSLRCAETIVVAGILHDVLEDTPTLPADLARIFGEEVLQIVLSATEPSKIGPDKNHTHSWKERKQHTIGFIRNEAKEEQLLVIAADKLDNIRAIRDDHERLGDKVWERFKASSMEQEWYYRGLLGSLQSRLREDNEALRWLTGEIGNEARLIWS